MKVTKHAVERIQGRTMMTVEEVHLIIRNNAVVTLNRDGRSAYLLFYSPLDRKNKYKIAVMTGDRVSGRESLVTVWNSDQRYPKGVRLVIDGRAKRDARKKAWALLFPYAPIVVKIEVLVGRKIEYVCELGTLPRRRDMKSIFKSFQGAITEVVSAVEESKVAAEEKPIGYHITLRREGKLIKLHTRTHDQMLARLRAVQP